MNWSGIPFLKEKPFQGWAGFGGGAGNLLQSLSGPGITVTGGNQTPTGAGSAGQTDGQPYGGKMIHVFTASGTLLAEGGNVPIEYVVIGAGAGGATGTPHGGAGGGGGAGGMLTGTATLVDGTPYSITIGSGGAAGSSGPTGGTGGNGGDTTFPLCPAVAGGGGGGGGAANSSGTYALAGTSGGGGCRGGGPTTPSPGQPGEVYSPTSPLHPAPAPGQGNSGGAGKHISGVTSCGGGGGGMNGGGKGCPGDSLPANSGGGGKAIQLPATFLDPNHQSTGLMGYPASQEGSPFPNWSTDFPGPAYHWVAGGGGGGRDGFTGGSGGIGPSPGASHAIVGGAGHGGPTPDASAMPQVAKANSGSGGGAFGAPPWGFSAGAGGSGMVLIAYPE